METFVIRAYGRTELAQCYFPNLSPQSAYRKLESWIDYHPTLRERLRSTNTNPHCGLIRRCSLREPPAVTHGSTSMCGCGL